MKKYKHVDYLWDTKYANKIKKDEVELLIYRSNLLGSDLRITNFGGGNTSCKTKEKDPLTKKGVDVMYVKGSGGDIGTIKRNGFSALYMDRLNHMKTIYRGLKYEDEMVALYNRCMFDLDSKAPSIDTSLHAFLPYKHIDHLHPDAVIAIAATKNSEKLTKEIWGKEMGWLPWQRPGFELGIMLSKLVEKKPNLKGIILEGHGLFTWGNTSFECYENSLNAIEKAGIYLEKAFKKTKSFGGQKIKSLSKRNRENQASTIAPLLRGLCSSDKMMVGHFTDDKRVLEFINSNQLDKLAPMGTSCPDHFLRTKIKPLILNLESNEDLTNTERIKKKLIGLFEGYRKDYASYYKKHKRDNSPDMRDPNPIVVLYPGIGMFTFAKNKQTARVASEFYINAINVMKGAEAVSKYVALPLQEAFDIEYWLLEEAKLQRQPAEKPLSRKIALVTGAGGGIGKAVAEKLISEGAVVVMTDINEKNLKEAASGFGKDNHRIIVSDITKGSSIEKAFKFSNKEFGGVDILVNSAGIAISKTLEDTSEKEWDLLNNILVKGQFMLSREAAIIMKKQNLGGDIINIVSKNALVSGPKNVGYGTAKGAQLHMSRLLAAELGPDKIRVNVVNPDAVIIGSKIWEGKWAAGRAKAYGIKVSELPAFYAKRTLLNEIILPCDIAKAVNSLLIDLKKSTGNIINVDGGIAAAFPR